MNYETLKLDQDGALLTVRLNRPEKRNAINRQMHADLQDLCHKLRDDTDTRVVIFGGEGGVFSAGADTSEWGDPGSSNELEVRHVSGVGSRTSGDIENLSQVTIAAVRGLAIGGGLVFVACCDLRVAGESAWFSIPEVELGLPLGWNALPRLAREMGHARALELTITCERFDARRAYEYGLVTHLEPDDGVEAKARALADAIIANPALPVALTKATMKALKRGSEMGDAAYSDQDMLLYTRLMAQRKARLEKEGRG
ncbi:MAG: enoyl-CoA hydratase/isomerase family protein [Chloroflexi bacterium]|nr:enoyl-CoA hydratase/isomerase family protein [Chloroflexota bacterium]MCI0817835.1 enoyl-CoA hydratase/isomerase family protein [Chloroflexota bacterium]MCI0832022.1 enoyl-CoA hydratase/isomerase family protein [Chloroflexota bacterium]MCI0839074.1 enoyl-CoA hydratase/isomerase family protein [Chloroflexota bacterium]MCI0842697.1 enoyl-CoA hydratase/isomerase family protein [Chloroflexota bacterium]